MPAKKKKAPKKSATSAKKGIFRSALTYKLLAVFVVLFGAWLIYLDAQVRYKFEGNRWQLPAQVYARALELYEGQALNLDNLEKELNLLAYEKTNAVAKAGTYSRNGQRIRIFRRGHQTVEGEFPAVDFTIHVAGDVVKSMRAAQGQTAAIYNLEPYKFAGLYPASKEERQLLRYDELPEGLVAALIATEDRDFFEHHGVSPKGIARAAIANLKAGRTVQGGSTLTQQLVKNFYLTRERSLSRKVNEAIMALMLDARYTKEDILEAYANDIYLGQSGNTAIHGFAMASLFYFGKALVYCDIDELALLVGMVKGPSYYDPRRNPDRALARRNLVLKLMHEEGWIDEDVWRNASARALQTSKKPTFQANRYPAFLDLVKRQLSAEYPEEALRSEGLKIYTTLDPQIQMNLEASIDTQMASLPGASEAQNPSPLQVGAVVTAVGTGEVLGLMGDKRGRFSGFNRALDARRAIGSLIKPAVYLSALRHPNIYNLLSPLSDQGFGLEMSNGETWEPKNFDGKSHGSLPLMDAFAKSLNIATARLGLEVGLDEVRDTLRELGVEGDLNPYPSLLLGAQAMSPFEVAKFYQTIASNGFNMPLRAIREVSDARYQVISRYPFQVQQVIEPEATFLLQAAMRETMRKGTGRSAYRRLPKALVTAGKTGTTNDNRDSWFAGFSGDYLGVIWVGKDDNSSTQLTGASGALKLWTGFMAAIPQYPLAMPRPSAVDLLWVDKQTGRRTDEACAGARPIPIWGSTNVPYQTCESGFESFSGWLKSWF